MAAIVREEAPPLTHAENEEFLRVLRDVRQWVGREPPEKVEVVFDGVSVEAEERVGRRALPTLPNAVFNAVKDERKNLRLFLYVHIFTTVM
ncbi:ABC transporter G family member 43-like [Panicum virgatum]|uniref:ABC transporter G family member 43-like n=1 Tax=Panicum virgatum TaxID=38727 RepID=UPI0019D5CFC5|nr:ABC transporter G family member 43-like [Panicum virgatum]